MAVRAILARAGRVAAVISNVNSNRYSTASALAEAVVEHVEVPAWRGPSKATPVVAPTKIVAEPSAATAALMQLERTYGANNYKSIGPVLVSGKGMYVTDVDGRVYLDCHAGFSAVNQGHAHPKIVEALVAQASTLGLVSRGLNSAAFARYAEYVTGLFGYDKVLPASTGAETGETAVKLARRWAYDVKGVPADKARVVFAAGNFWGRTLAAVSSSTDPSASAGFGPLLPGFLTVPYDDLGALQAAIAHPHTAAFMVEPVQGEAGCRPPSPGYLAEAARLCREANVLFIADEVQSGVGRCGALSAAAAAGARPDILCLGKALGGGLYPVSAVMADDKVMGVIKPGQHGSTWGGNPVACAVATASLQVVVDEKLGENAASVGAHLTRALQALVPSSGGALASVRGQGLLVGVVMGPPAPGRPSAWQLCERLIARSAVLAKPTGLHGDVVRFAPPLAMTVAEADRCVAAVKDAVASFA